MFIGEYRHNIDAKGRLFLPVKFREKLGEEFIFSRGLDKCVCIYPVDEWEMGRNDIVGDIQGNRNVFMQPDPDPPQPLPLQHRSQHFHLYRLSRSRLGVWLHFPGNDHHPSVFRGQGHRYCGSDHHWYGSYRVRCDPCLLPASAGFRILHGDRNRDHFPA